jgi:hypothetical protein
MAQQADQTRGPTHDQLTSLHAKSRGDAGKSSRRTYGAALDTRWENFAKSENSSSEALKAQLVTSNHEVNTGLIDRFFLAMWCDTQNNEGKVYALSKSSCDTASKGILLWVNDLLGIAGKDKISSIKNLVSLFAENCADCFPIGSSSRARYSCKHKFSLGI